MNHQSKDRLIAVLITAGIVGIVVIGVLVYSVSRGGPARHRPVSPNDMVVRSSSTGKKREARDLTRRGVDRDKVRKNYRLPDKSMDARVFQAAAQSLKSDPNFIVAANEYVIESLTPFRVEYGPTFEKKVETVSTERHRLYDRHGKPLFDRYGQPLYEEIPKTVEYYVQSGDVALAWFKADPKGSVIRDVDPSNKYIFCKLVFEQGSKWVVEMGLHGGGRSDDPEMASKQSGRYQIVVPRDDPMPAIESPYSFRIPRGDPSGLGDLMPSP